MQNIQDYFKCDNVIYYNLYDLLRFPIITANIAERFPRTFTSQCFNNTLYVFLASNFATLEFML